jgi:hypothetical protein
VRASLLRVCPATFTYPGRRGASLFGLLNASEAEISFAAVGNAVLTGIKAKQEVPEEAHLAGEGFRKNQ